MAATLTFNKVSGMLNAQFIVSFFFYLLLGIGTMMLYWKVASYLAMRRISDKRKLLAKLVKEAVIDKNEIRLGFFTAALGLLFDAYPCLLLLNLGLRFLHQP